MLISISLLGGRLVCLLGSSFWRCCAIVWVENSLFWGSPNEQQYVTKRSFVRCCLKTVLHIGTDHRRKAVALFTFYEGVGFGQKTTTNHQWWFGGASATATIVPIAVWRYPDSQVVKLAKHTHTPYRDGWTGAFAGPDMVAQSELIFIFSVSPFRSLVFTERLNTHTHTNASDSWWTRSSVTQTPLRAPCSSAGLFSVRALCCNDEGKYLRPRFAVPWSRGEDFETCSSSSSSRHPRKTLDVNWLGNFQLFVCISN